MQAAAPQRSIQGLSEAYHPPGQYFVADEFAPVLPVDGTRFAYHTFDTIRQRILQDNTRAPGGDVNEVRWDVTENTGMTVERALQSAIDRKTVRDFGRSIAEDRAMRAVKDNMLIQREERIRALIQTEANYPSSSYYTTLTGTSQWSDLENSDPEDDVRTAIEQVLSASGLLPNKIMIPYEVANKLVQHPVIKDVMIRDTRGSQSEAFKNDPNVNGLPSELWGLSVGVPKVTYVDSNPGQTESQAFLWGKKVWIGYVNSQPSVDTPSFAYQFTAQGLQVGIGNSNIAGGGEYVEGVEDDLQKVVGTRMGYLISAAVA
jgi:hypothetical protein